MRITPKLFAALLLLVLGLLRPLFVKANADDPTLPDQCASTQPELRTLFPTEMELLNNFEGSWADIVYQKNIAAGNYNSLSFNSNKKLIQMQIRQTRKDGDINSEVHTVKICKTKKGVMRIVGGPKNEDIDILVLDNMRLRFRIGSSWYPFWRTTPVHGAFLPPTGNAKSAESAEVKVADPADGDQRQ